jgi:hypothetical protein
VFVRGEIEIKRVASQLTEPAHVREVEQDEHLHPGEEIVDVADHVAELGLLGEGLVHALGPARVGIRVGSRGLVRLSMCYAQEAANAPTSMHACAHSGFDNGNAFERQTYIDQ